MKKKVFIYAYTLMNLGDDLFVKILCDRYPNVNFYIVCVPNKSYAFKEVKNLKVIYGVPYIDAIFRKLKIKISINTIIQKIVSYYCDIIVNIGGSLFIENSTWEYDIKNYKRRFFKKKPYFIIGSNFGPYKDLNFYNQFKDIFEKCTDICFREKYSYDIFSDLNNVRYAPDVVFSYETEKYVKSDTNNKNKSIIVSVINLEQKNELRKFKNMYKRKITDLSRRFINENYKVIFMGFCKKEGDEEVINEFINEFTEEEKKLIDSYIYNGNIEETLKIIEMSTGIIATRFHSMILGWVYDKVVYPLTYSEKSYNVIKDMKFNGEYSAISEIENLNVDNVYEYLVKNSPINIENQIQMSKLQFEKLDECILKL